MISFFLHKMLVFILASFLNHFLYLLSRNFAFPFTNFLFRISGWTVVHGAHLGNILKIPQNRPTNPFKTNDGKTPFPPPADILVLLTPACHQQTPFVHSYTISYKSGFHSPNTLGLRWQSGQGHKTRDRGLSCCPSLTLSPKGMKGESIKFSISSLNSNNLQSPGDIYCIVSASPLCDMYYWAHPQKMRLLSNVSRFPEFAV